MLDSLGESADPARLVHHATEANDVGAIVAAFGKFRDGPWDVPRPVSPGTTNLANTNSNT